MAYDPLNLESIARECKRVYDAAVADLGVATVNRQILDLMADNIEDVPLTTLVTALVVAGFPVDNRGVWRG